MLDKALSAKVEEIRRANPLLHRRLAIAEAKSELGYEPTGEDFAKLGNIQFADAEAREYAAKFGLEKSDFSQEDLETLVTVEACNAVADKLNSSIVNESLLVEQPEPVEEIIPDPAPVEEESPLDNPEPDLDSSDDLILP